MIVSCPYCQETMTAKAPRPGRYRPLCNACGARFFLEIPEAAPRVLRLEELEDLATAFHGSHGAEHATVSPQSEAAFAGLREATARTRSVDASAAQELVAPHGIAEMPDRVAALDGRTLDSGAEGSRFDGEDDFFASSFKERFASRETLRSAGAAPIEETADYASTELRSSESEAGEDPEAIGSAPLELPRTLGGYRIERELGRGAMGAVYQVKQLSLDRSAALKVIRRKHAADPRFIGRFVREAYAAAQLVHHNIVQIYDMGEHDGFHWFSMELVKGPTLEQLLKEKRRLAPDEAAAYLLQACRGLLYAHESGMVHRDVKPANILVNDRGVVKIADLGLVKTPQEVAHDAPARLAKRAIYSQRTEAGVTLGTPAFMSPEQAEDASSVDHRADIYSLGCTFYAMLTGRMMFDGATANEVLAKHRTAAVIRPETIVQRLPADLSRINLRMVEKKPDDRYQSLAETIADLEEHLGLRGGARRSMTAEQGLLTSLSDNYRKSKWARRRSMLLTALASALVLGVVGALFALNPTILVAAFSLLLTTAAAYVVVRGIFVGDPLFDRVRALTAESGPVDWITWITIGALMGAALGVAGLLLPFLAAAAVAVLLSVLLHFGIDRLVERERRPVLEEADSILRRLRLQGVDDVKLRECVVHSAGKDWEEFYEAVFGYDAKIRARATLNDGHAAPRSRKFAAWREPLIRRLDAATDERRRRRDRRRLERLEIDSLRAEGVDADTARRRAAGSAEAMIDNAAAFRQTALGASTARKALLKGVLAGKNATGRVRPTFLETVRRAAWTLLSPRIRFVTGVAFLALCYLWIGEIRSATSQKRVGFEDAGDLVSPDLVVARSLDPLAALVTRAGFQETTRALSFVPEPFDILFNSLNVGLAGALLVLSTLIGNRRGILLATLAAAIAFLFVPLAGDAVPSIFPPLGPVPGLPIVSGVVAVALFVLALVVPNRTRI